MKERLLTLEKETGEEYSPANEGEVSGWIQVLKQRHPSGCYKYIDGKGRYGYVVAYDDSEGQECWGTQQKLIEASQRQYAQDVAAAKIIEERPELFKTQEAGYGGIWAMFAPREAYTPLASQQRGLELMKNLGLGCDDCTALSCGGCGLSQRPQGLEFGFGDIADAFKSAGGFLQRNIARPIQKLQVGKAIKATVRYGGAAIATAGPVPIGLLMTARQRQKMFGLTDSESGKFEVLAKVGRGLIATAAAVVTGGKALTIYNKIQGPLKGVMAGAKSGEWIAKTADAVIAVKKATDGTVTATTFPPASVPAEAGTMKPGDYFPIGGDMTSFGRAAIPAGTYAPSSDEESLKDALINEQEKAKAEAAPSFSPGAFAIGAVGVLVVYAFLKGRR